MSSTFNDNPDLIKKVITGYKLWVYGYNLKIKAHSSLWKRPEEPRPKKARQVRTNVKSLLTVFIDWNGVVHNEWIRNITLKLARLVRANIFRDDNAAGHHKFLLQDQ